MSLAEQTGMSDDPAFIERIAMGLQTDTYVEGLRDAQLAIDSGEFFQGHFHSLYYFAGGRTLAVAHLITVLS